LGRIPRRAVGGAGSFSASPSANSVGRRERGCLQVRRHSVVCLRCYGASGRASACAGFRTCESATWSRAPGGGTERARRCRKGRTAPPGAGGGPTTPVGPPPLTRSRYADRAMPNRRPEPWGSGARGPFLWIEDSAVEVWALGEDRFRITAPGPVARNRGQGDEFDQARPEADSTAGSRLVSPAWAIRLPLTVRHGAGVQSALPNPDRARCSRLLAPG
jgi:hypothetical protein